MAMTTELAVTNHTGELGKSTSANNTAVLIILVIRRAQAPHCRALVITTDSQGHTLIVTTGRKDTATDAS